MKYLVAAALITVLATSCERKKLCSVEEQRTDGVVLKVSGPDSLNVGEKVPVLIEVAVNDSFCVKKAEGVIIATIGNHVQVGAKLVHSGPKGDNDCECTDEKTIHTLVYFTPNVPGFYMFSSQPPSPITSHGDTSGYQIIVH